jgi:hypothetical protein
LLLKCLLLDFLGLGSGPLLGAPHGEQEEGAGDEYGGDGAGLHGSILICAPVTFAKAKRLLMV